LKDASTDPDVIRGWWTRDPDANVGLRMGPAGLVGIDVDVKDGAPGMTEWRELVAELGPGIEATLCAETPSGGMHFYYSANGHSFPPSAGKLAPGLDVRAGESYLVAPPSETGAGRYSWAIASGPDDRPIADLPEGLAARILKARKPTKNESTPGKIPTGRRNDTLTRLAGAMRRQGCGPGAILAGLREHNKAHCSPPLPDSELQAIAKSITRLYEPALQGNRPRVNATENDLSVVSAQAWDAIVAANEPPRLFVRAGLPVRVDFDEGAPTLRELGVDQARHEAARSAYWYAPSFVEGVQSGERAAKPPVGVVRDMLAFPAYPLPPLERIVRAPTFAPDGTLQARDGYHPAGRVLVCMPPSLVVPAVPDVPTPAQLSAAIALFDDMLVDFPMVGAADRAHALALALLPFTRDLIDGPTPLHLVEAPIAGTGKGLLVHCLLSPAVGQSVGTLAAGRDEDEWRKRISTVLLGGQAAVVIDNVDATITSAALSSALTATRWEDRRLGGNERIALPVRCAWAATGNNPLLSTEIARRCVRIRLDARIDQPWRRDPAAFRHPQLRSWVSERRGELIAAALTLVQGWLRAGRPSASSPPLGSFEAWSSVIGGVLAHAGVDGFLQNLDELYERADAEGAVWRRFVATWWESHGETAVGVAELFPLAEAMEDFPLGKATSERGQKTKLGAALKAHLDMIVGDFRVAKAPVSHSAARYTLQRVRLTPAQEEYVAMAETAALPL